MNNNFMHKFISAEQDIAINDPEQQLVEGYVTDDKIDLDGHVIDKDGFRDAVLDYLKWGNIREQHGDAVGTVVDAPEWNKFVAKIVDDSAWKKIKGGVYKGFSVGIRVLDFVLEPVEKYTDMYFDGLPQAVVRAIKEYGQILRITKMVLVEVSVVDRPANPRAMITAYKSVGVNKEQLPVAEQVVNAQKQLIGDIMENENVNLQPDAVEETPAESIAEPIETAVIQEKNVEVAQGQAEASLEEKIAVLEKALSEIDGRVSTLFSQLEEKLTQIGDAIGKFVTQEPAQENTDDASTTVGETKGLSIGVDGGLVVNDITVAKETVVSLDTDTIADKLYEKIEKNLADYIAKAIEEVNSKGAERVAGVNGSADFDGATSVNKGAEAQPQKKEKPTYQKAAMLVARAMNTVNTSN